MTSTQVRPAGSDGDSFHPQNRSATGGGLLPAAALGLRFAARARPSRSALMVVGSTLATALLLTAVGAYVTGLSVLPRLDGDELRLLLTIVVAVACPVLVLLLTAARLSSTSRDARSAALSRLGVSTRRLRMMAAVENGVLALVGATAGLALHLLVVAPAFGSVAAQLGWFQGRAPRATLSTALGVLVLVVAAAAAASYLPHRAARPGAAVRTSTARPTWWRLVPLAAGAASLALATALHRNSDASPTGVELALFLGGGALSILGLPIALPVAVRLIGDLVVRGRTPSVVIAGRGLQAEPANTTRLVAAVLAAITVVTGAFCVLETFWDLPQVQRAVIADSTGPQYGDLGLQLPGAPAVSNDLLAELAATPGVRAAVAVPDALLENAPGGCELFDDPAALCGQAFVGSCADLTALAGPATGCSDDALAQIVNGDQALPDTIAWNSTTATWLRPSSYPGSTVPASVEVSAVTGRIVVPVDADDPNRSFQYSVFVPIELAAQAALPPTQILLVLDGGAAGRGPIAAQAARLGLPFWAEDVTALRQVEGYESMVWGVGGVMLATGLAGLAIAGADGAVERRRRLASLWVLGTPARVIRRSQLLRALLPLVIGAPIATVIGGLVGVAYLSLVGTAGRFPWQQTGTLLGITVVAAGLVSLVTLVGLGAKPSPELVRRD